MKKSFICDKNTFNYIYRLEKYRCQRKWHRSYLSRIKIKGIDRKKLQGESNRLLSLLAEKLRAGDVVCRWNDDQYLIILYDINNINTEKVMKRIFNNFLKNESDSGSDLKIDYQSLN
ncbi:MAG: hypothetical protein ACLFUK_05150 [Halanaerobium sp.]